MSIKMTIMRKLTQWLVGSDVFSKIEKVVLSLMDSSMTGEQKKNLALNQLKDLGTDVSKTLINLAIEVAVSYFKLNTTKAS